MEVVSEAHPEGLQLHALPVGHAMLSQLGQQAATDIAGAQASQPGKQALL